MKKYFNKNLFTAEQKKENFRSINACWICEKIIEDEKVRDHCHITGKCRGTAHWSCIVNPKLAKSVSIIFHSLKSYDSHLIMINTHRIKKKYMAFSVNKHLVFVDSKTKKSELWL